MQPSDETPIEPTEILELRTETAKHFDNGDGTFTAEIHGLPIHYDDNGEYKDINPELKVDNTDSDFTHVADEVEMKVGLIDTYDQPTHFSRAGYEDLIITPLNANSVAGNVDGNIITYVDAYTNTDVTQETTAWGLKETYILKEAGHPTRFSFSINTAYTPKHSKSNLVYLDGANLAYRLKPLTVEGTDTILSWHYSGDTVYFDVPADITYPYVIDPSISPYASADGRVNGSNGSWATARSTGFNASNSGTQESIASNLFIGNYTNYHLYFEYDTSSIGSGQAVSSASLSFYGSGAASVTDGTPEIHAVSHTATVSSLTNSDYSNVGSTSFGYVNLNTTSNAYFTITLNTAGKNNINMTGTSKFALRTSLDLNNTTPTGFNTRTINMVDYTGTSTDPYLSVTYSAAAAAKLPPSKIITQAINRSGSF